MDSHEHALIELVFKCFYAFAREHFPVVCEIDHGISFVCFKMGDVIAVYHYKSIGGWD